jgi:hypothetical protein
VAKNNKPVVTPSASTQVVALDASVAVSSLFSVNDADGDAITQYKLTETTKGGYFEVNGVRVGGKSVTVSAADLASVRYVAGAVNGSEMLSIQASDGKGFGAKASFEMQTRGPNRTPVVTPSASTQNVSVGSSVAVSSLFTVSDADGDGITQYRLTDGGTGGGYFELNGVRAATPTVTVSAADLATTRYVAAVIGSDTLTVEARDGTSFGTAASFDLVTRWVNRGPVVTPTASTQNVSSGGSVAVSSLFTVNDPDGDTITQYRLTDGNSNAKGGYLEVNGVRAPKKGALTVSAADLANVRYVGGTKDGSETLTVEASDGTVFGPAASFTVATRGKAPVVTPGRSMQGVAFEQSVAVSSLFSVSDPDGDAITHYRLTDGGVGGGYFELDGVKAATQTVTVSAADLATTRYVAGTVAGPAGTETLTIQASDGSAFGVGASFAMQTFIPRRLGEVLGSNNSDGFRVWGDNIYFGGEGDDFYIANANISENDSIAKGGPGGDDYRIDVSGAMIVLENGNSVGDTLTMANFGFGLNTSYAGLIDGRHLVLVDERGSSLALIVDWTVPENRIEEFKLSGGSYTFSQFSTAISGMNVIPFTWADLGELKERADEEFSYYASYDPGPLNHAPRISPVRAYIATGKAMPGTTMVPARDQDGDLISLFEFADNGATANGGYFRLNGVVQAPNQPFIVAAENLSTLEYVGGGVVGEERVIVRAYDGRLWGDSEFVITTTQNHVPYVDNILFDPSGITYLNAGQSVLLESLLRTDDTDGDPITQYRIQERGGGYFEVDGVAYPNETLISVDAADILKVRYVTSSNPTNLVDGIEVNFTDGQSSWSWTSFSVRPEWNFGPMVQAQPVRVVPGESIAASSMFSVLDMEGDPVTQYRFLPSPYNGPNSVLTLDGVAQTAEFTIDAADLSSVQVRGGIEGEIFSVYIYAFDGNSWGSGWAGAKVTSIAAPPVVEREVHLAPGQVISAPLLLSDSSNDRYFGGIVVESASSLDGGYFIATGGSRVLQNATLHTPSNVLELYVASDRTSIEYLYFWVADGPGNRHLATVGVHVGSFADDAGGNLAGARQVTVGSTPQKFTEAVGGTDVDDFYRLDVTEPGVLMLDVYNLSQNADLQLLDGSGNPLVASARPATVADYVSANVGAGTYYARVYAAPGTLPTEYSLAVTLG